MKHLMAGVAVAAMTSTVAFAESPLFANSYVTVGTDFEGATNFTGGTEFGAYGFDLFGEFTYKDRVDANSDNADDYVVTVGTNMDLSVLEISSGVSYSWGATNGADLIGSGEDNTWGDVVSTTGAKFATDIIGGDYVYGNLDVALYTAEKFNIDVLGGDIGFGYKHDLSDTSHFKITYGWDIEVDEEDNWNLADDGELGFSFGFKF